MLLSNSYQKKKLAIGQSTQPPRPPNYNLAAYRVCPRAQDFN